MRIATVTPSAPYVEPTKRASLKLLVVPVLPMTAMGKARESKACAVPVGMRNHAPQALLNQRRGPLIERDRDWWLLGPGHHLIPPADDLPNHVRLHERAGRHRSIRGRELQQADLRGTSAVVAYGCNRVCTPRLRAVRSTLSIPTCSVSQIATAFLDSASASRIGISPLKRPS